MAAVRGALLKHLRVNATPLSLLRNPNPTRNGLFALTFSAIRRGFSDEVMGSFLDKSEVTDRVLCVVKNFQKVDPSKGFKSRSRSRLRVISRFRTKAVELRRSLTDFTPIAVSYGGRCPLFKYLVWPVNDILKMEILFCFFGNWDNIFSSQI